MPDSLPERLQDATIVRATQTERYAASLSRRILAMLEELETELVTKLQRRDLDPTAPVRTAFQRRRLEALLAETRKLITEHYRGMYRETRGELVEFAGVEQAATAHLLNTEIGATLLRPGIAAPGILRALVDDTFISGGATQAAPLKEWYGRLAASTQQKVSAAIRAGMLQDETIGQIIRRLRGTKAAQYKDGILSSSYREAEAITRTSVLAIQNTARETTWKEYPDVVRGVSAVITLDSRTSYICISRNNAAWDINTGRPLPWSAKKEPYPGPPPWHVNCRSTLIAVTRDYSDMLRHLDPSRRKAALQQFTPEERDALVFRPPKQEDYSTWLHRQSSATQTKVLGARRRELWLRGDLDLHDLVDQRGRPLTLAELKEVA